VVGSAFAFHAKQQPPTRLLERDIAYSRSPTATRVSPGLQPAATTLLGVKRNAHLLPAMRWPTDALCGGIISRAAV
jgi:hypothetical protein